MTGALRRLAALALLCSVSGTPVWAQQPFPNRQVTLVSFSNPGSGVDANARAWAQCAAGQQGAGSSIVVLNRPGANGVIATRAVQQAPADGHTVLLAAMSTLTITPFTFKTPPFDPQADLEPVAIFGTSPLLLVASAQSGIRNVKDIQAFAKASGKGLDYGVSQLATPGHLIGAALSQKLGIETTYIPTNGEPAGVTAMIGGQLPVMTLVAGTALPHIASGKLVPLLVFNTERLKSLPDVPTVNEALQEPALARTAWLGVAVRKGTPPDAVAALEKWTRTCMDSPELRQALGNMLVTPTFMGREQMADQVRRDIAFWQPWIKKLGISND